MEIYLAQHLNSICGGNVVAPWQIGQVPERYLEAALGLSKLQSRKKRLEQNRASLDRTFKIWRSQHPSYKQ